MSTQLKYLITVIFLFSVISINGQNTLLQIISIGNSKEVLNLNYKKKHSNNDLAIKEVENVIMALQYKGYLLAVVDSLKNTNNLVQAFINENNQYYTANLKIGNLDPSLASKLGISEKLFLNKPFKYKDVAKIINKIIVHYENNGYPFASVNLDSVSTDNKKISAKLNVQKNKIFKIDSISLYGTAKVNKKFIYRYLSIKENMLYNEAVLSSLSQKIKQLPFVTEKQVPEIRLTEKSNRLRLFLDKKTASQFDGIIGLLPDAENNKTIVTGDVKLKLVNGIFRNGETFDLEWRRLQSLTQDFKGRVIYPYLFGTPIGIDYAIKIYKRDTTFIDINNNLGLQYYFSGLNNFKVFYKDKITNLISTSGLSYITVLPDYADITTKSYGFGLFYEKLNYRFNPHKGFSFNVNAQTGNRTIKKNPKINETAYNNLKLISTQYQLEGDLNIFLKLYRNNVLKIGVQGASVFGNSALFKNELFRIGGLKTLRGFDEESIFASSYLIPTIEYRFLFAQNSNLLLFTEGAWYENTVGGGYINDTPISFGAGINFETKAGILTMNYAVGNQFGNGFDLRSGKIHFGLTALF